MQGRWKRFLLKTNKQIPVWSYIISLPEPKFFCFLPWESFSFHEWWLKASSCKQVSELNGCPWINSSMLPAITQKEWKRSGRKKKEVLYLKTNKKSLNCQNHSPWRDVVVVPDCGNKKQWLFICFRGREAHSRNIITQLVVETLLWGGSTLVSLWNGMNSWHDGHQTWKSVVKVRTTDPGGSLLLSSRGWRYLRHMR